MSSSEIKKILVFNPSFIGDAILTTPLINMLAQLYPKSQIDFCLRPESAPLFKEYKLNNMKVGIIPFDKRGKYSGLKGIRTFSKELKAKKYNMVITPHKSFRTLLTLYLARIPVRIGFQESAGAFLLTKKLSRDMKLHEVERNLSLLTLVSKSSLKELKEKAGTLYTYLDKDFYNKIKKDDKKVVGISAGSTWPTKRWPVENFFELAKMLHEKGYSIALTGGPADKPVVGELMQMLDKAGISYIDYLAKVPFEEIPAVIHSFKLLITNDSAPLHIAVSQGVPVVAIFGATVPSLGFAPYDNKSLICENNDLDCRPCGLHGGKSCPLKHFKCMLDLKPEEVFAKAMRILE